MGIKIKPRYHTYGFRGRDSGKMRDMKLRNLLLKTVPYLLSVAGGATLYLVSKDSIHDPSLNDLVNNIAASLLAIPLVFLLYDYSNYRISRQVNKTLADGLNFKINSVMLELLIGMRSILGMRGKFTWGGAEKMFVMTARAIGKKIKIKSTDIDTLRQVRDKIDDFAYHTDRGSILDREQLALLGQLARAITHLLNEHRFAKNSHVGARYVQHILSLMGDWFDSQDVNEILKQQNFQIAMGSSAPASSG